MEVKPGYKQTEVGVIPEDWALAPLVELIDESRSIRYGIVQPGKFDPAGRYMVRGQDYSTGWVAPSELFRVSPQVEEPFKNARVKTGDVVITIVGASTGHIEVIPDWLDGANLTQTTARLAINPAKAFSGFCKCYLQSAAGQRQVANYLKGAAQPGLNCGDIEKFRIPLPPTLPEQRAIATALSDVDGLLDGLDRLIVKKRDLKQAAMQQLLTGQTRLPGFSGEWEVKRLGDLFNFSGGYSASRDQLSTEGNCYLHYGDIHGSTKTCIDTDADFQDIPKLDIPLKRVSSASLLDDGDVVFVDASEDDAGTSKHVVVVNKSKKPFISGLHTIVAKSKTDELAHEFRRYCFQTPAIRQQFLFYSVGTKVSGISKSNIPKLTLSFPSLPEQTAIAEVLTEIDGELAALEQRREKTRALKQAMMQELLTGRIRLV